MKEGRNLNEVIRSLAALEETKKDYCAPSVQMEMSGDASSFILNGSAISQEMGMSGLFHSQIGTALGIPAKYYAAMKNEQPGLLAENVNTWLKAGNRSYMVRTADYGEGRTARAFLSDRYRRIDNLQVANAVLPLFMGREQFNVESCEATESRLYLKIVDKRLEAEVAPGDIVQAGVMISNSEVGLGAVVVAPLVYRLVCTNGMVVNDGKERRRHVGRRQEGDGDYFTVYSDETLEAEDRAFMLRLRDAAVSALDEARFASIVGRLKSAKENKITGRIGDVVEMTGKEFLLNGDEQDNVLRFLIEGGDFSQYGLSNAVTRTAQESESYDRATVLEATGWEVASMNMSRWSALNRRVAV